MTVRSDETVSGGALEHLRALAVFAHVVEHGSFRAAAKALRLSPSVVSHHVSALEARLAVPLLYRSTRRLALTPDGETLFASARAMVQAAERGLDTLGGRAESPRGVLRISAPAFLAATPFCRDLAAFAEAHPRVSLEVGFTELRRDLLKDGLDLALRFGALDDSTLKARKVADMPRVLVATQALLAREGAPRSVADLARFRFVRLSPRAAEVTLAPRTGKKRGARTHRFEPSISVDSAAAMRELALAGAGIAGVPEVLVRADLAAGRLAVVLPRWRMPSIGVYAVWPSHAVRPELTTRFVEFMAPRLAALFATHPER
jgi:DNA-binding transcriptional LysR family regulator